MFQKAEVAWKSLNGIICAYKPAEASCDYVKHKIISNLCYDLNNLETRPPENYLDIIQKGREISINVRPSFADNVLCVGPRYQEEDFEVRFPSFLGKKVSGVLILGINGGVKIGKSLRSSFLTKCYHVKGILGQATENFYIDSKVIAKAKFDYVNSFMINKILASYQAASQRRIFKEYGLNVQSQEAYDLITSGLYRPREKKTPVIYSLKCINFQPPNFTIEVNCINEDEITLMNIIHNLGVSMKCFATCTGLQCIRHGCFTVHHALLKKHWKLQYISENMQLCFSELEKFFPDTLEYTPTIRSHAGNT